MYVSIFDLDGTLVKGNSSFSFLKYLLRKKVFPPVYFFYSLCYFFLFRYGKLSIQELHEKVFARLLKGVRLQTVQEHVETFVSEYLEKALYAPTVMKLRLAQKLGHYTVILSNSPSFLVSAIAKRLHVHEWESTHYAVDKAGNLCHISSILKGEDKALYVALMREKYHLPRGHVTAYSDSIHDLAFLEAAGVSIVVNPDAKLKGYSKKKSWQQI